MNVLPEDVTYLRTLIANVVMVEDRSDAGGGWVLIDTGVPTYADQIMEAAEARFGIGVKPKAIVLTHGHFDHVGSIRKLLEHWEVPIYAHELELPYLTGKADYPEADSSVGGGLMAGISPLYPHKGIDLGHAVRPLPKNGSIPVLKDWKWIHTPGHTEGHISLYRAADRTLIAGDAFITVKQESVFAVLTQDKEIHGPPAYFTFDWSAAHASVQKLAALRPAAVITGHGVPMTGQELLDGLEHLARDFTRLAVPKERQGTAG